jgi:hypothetical protein
MSTSPSLVTVSGPAAAAAMIAVRPPMLAPMSTTGLLICSITATVSRHSSSTA